MAISRRVAIVPGHGGDNRGTPLVAPDEATCVLDFGRILHARCKAFWPDAYFWLLRDGDYDLSLTEAAEKAQRFECDVAIVLHINAYVSPVLHGGLAFAMEGDDLGLASGSEILRSYPWELRPQRDNAWEVPGSTRGWMRPVRNVLAPYWQRGISSVLCELFYASSPPDLEASRSESVSDRLQLALMSGIAVALARRDTA